MLGKLLAVSLGVVGLVFSLWSDCGANQVCRVRVCMVITAHARYAFCYEAGLCTEAEVDTIGQFQGENSPQPNLIRAAGDQLCHSPAGMSITATLQVSIDMLWPQKYAFCLILLKVTMDPII